MTAWEKFRMVIALPLFLFGMAAILVAAIVGGEKFATIVWDNFKKGMERHV